MRIVLLLGALWATCLVQAQEIAIIPKPAEMKVGRRHLTIKQPIGFIYHNEIPEDYGVSFFKDYLEKYYNISRFAKGNTHSDDLPTEIFVDYEKDFSPAEGYELTVNKKGINLKGNDVGLFYAFQTLIQLLPVNNGQLQTSNNKLEIPYVSIKDYPRFGYRGMHLDCGRHFFPVAFVKKYIDYIALHKMNYFHWHLTEDQGWRIDIKKYPKLTQVGAWRNGTIVGNYPGKGNDGIRYGGYYTQDEIKDVVVYAAKRYITVIPEIEMPGHSSAAIASYPYLSCFPDESTKHPPECEWSGDSTGKQVQQTWGVFEDVFCAGKESTFKFLEDVLDEVMALFPSKYIHIGGDECPKENWHRCPLCQQRIKTEHLKDENELQSYFVQRIEKYLNNKGRTLIGWDEILEGGLAPNAVVMSWRGEEGGIAAAKQKHKVIMTPINTVYFNLAQSRSEDSITYGDYIPTDTVYRYDPVPKELDQQEAKYILGSQGNLWSEYTKNEKLVEYMIFPRMTALSEVLWSKKPTTPAGGEDRDWDDFMQRLETQYKRYDLWGAHYNKSLL